MLGESKRHLGHFQAMEAWPERLSRLRNAVQPRLSQAKVAKALGISAPSVAQWEIGRSRPTVDKLVQLAALYRVSLAELCGSDLPLPDESPFHASGASLRTAAPPTAQRIWRAVGNRMNFVRTARMLADTPEVVASHMHIDLVDLNAYEAGERPAPLELLISFCGQFAVSADFLLLGHEDRLDDYLRSRLPPKKAHTP
jgi:transcriptional regulator with XRE-family HTH domain